MYEPIEKQDLVCHSFHQVQGKRYSNKYAKTQDSYKIRKNRGVTVSGVFDGHGEYGSEISAEIADVLTQRILAEISEFDPPDLIRTRVSELFFEFAVDHKHDSMYQSSGSTAVIAIETGNHLIFFTCGDSQAFWQQGGINRASAILYPDSIQEVERYKNMTGVGYQIVNSVARIVGAGNIQLAVSRAIGDFSITPKMYLDENIFAVSPYPLVDIIEKRLVTSDFYLLCSDGITETELGADDIMAFTDCKSLIDKALEFGSSDDITAVRIQLSLTELPEIIEVYVYPHVQIIPKLFNSVKIASIVEQIPTRGFIQAKDFSESLKRFASNLSNAVKKSEFEIGETVIVPDDIDIIGVNYIAIINLGDEFTVTTEQLNGDSDKYSVSSGGLIVVEPRGIRRVGIVSKSGNVKYFKLIKNIS
jgi:serine/threonine protein phosphatase PrpC